MSDEYRGWCKNPFVSSDNRDVLHFPQIQFAENICRISISTFPKSLQNFFTISAKVFCNFNFSTNSNCRIFFHNLRFVEFAKVPNVHQNYKFAEFGGTALELPQCSRKSNTKSTFVVQGVQRNQKKKTHFVGLFFFLTSLWPVLPLGQCLPRKSVALHPNVCTKVLLCTQIFWKKLLLCIQNVSNFE